MPSTERSSRFSHVLRCGEIGTIEQECTPSISSTAAVNLNCLHIGEKYSKFWGLTDHNSYTGVSLTKQFQCIEFGPRSICAINFDSIHAA
jgi:hypothetical protein